MFYVAYLDEFGHIGPYISRNDPIHKTSPIFGLGGIVLPVERVRSFASWYYRLKCALLEFEIRHAGIPAYQWEKKGAALYTTQNVTKYPQLRHATARLLNRVERDGGMVLYVGTEKTHSPADHNPKRLYQAILRECIKRLNQYCEARKALFMVILDEQQGKDFRAQIVADASRGMFGGAQLSTMIEPPIQAESHLFQTLQCADWICGLVGRVACYRVASIDYPDLEWTLKYFSQRLARVAPLSGIRHDRTQHMLDQIREVSI